MRIQAYLTAAAINLKRLAAALLAPTVRWLACRSLGAMRNILYSPLAASRSDHRGGEHPGGETARVASAFAMRAKIGGQKTFPPQRRLFVVVLFIAAEPADTLNNAGFFSMRNRLRHHKIRPAVWPAIRDDWFKAR